MADALTRTAAETPPPAKPVNPFLGDEREDAILRERLATIDNAISLEELNRRVERAVRRLLAERSPGTATGTGEASAAPPAPRT